MTDPHNLQRFVDAQAPIFDQVLAELRRHHKQGHWMWFIFPQIDGLGFSPLARRYAISGRAEAAAYLAHPVLGPRLIECTHLVNSIDASSAHQIFGPIDTLKFRSSMTLFAAISPPASVFSLALHHYFAAQPDPLTLARL